jgi:glycosyltransferase involved in cell wall biosynthesis
MSEILFVGKPIEPPWNDSSKNLARDLVTSMEKHVPVVLARKSAPHPGGRARVDAIFSDAATGFQPAVTEKAKLLARIARAREPLVHFFFAPNMATSTASRSVVAARRLRSVHTICSAPHQDVDLRWVLFADVQVVLSKHTERRFLDAGIAPSRVRRIPPSIPVLDVPSSAERAAVRREFALPERAFLVVFPGDLEFGNGAATMIEAIAGMRDENVVLVMACRTKTERSRTKDTELRALALTLGAAHRVHWTGETRRIHALLGAADLVCLPTDSLYAKMDYPLVLLEAMSMERPVVVARGTPAEELARGGAAMSVDPGVDDVVAAIEQLKNDPAAAHAIGVSGRSRVLAEHTQKAMARAYEALYDELLGAKSR